MSRPKKRRSAASIELELDGYESTSSAEDFSDAFDGEGSDIELVDDTGQGNNNPLLGINITDEYSGISLPDIQINDTEDPFQNTELVVKFHHNIKPQALVWFIEKVTAKKSHGGAELLLKREPYKGLKNEGLVVHVTATCWRQLEVAEMLEIKKLDYSSDNVSPIPREFKIREIVKFLKEDMEHNDILTSAEKQMVVMHELKNFHSLPGEKHVPGYKDIRLVPGQSIFHTYRKMGLIKSYFALHVEEELKTLSNKWFLEFFDKWPYEHIRSYFGDSTCLYFNFVAYYSLWLTFPTITGVIIQFLLPQAWQDTAVVIFCLINMVFLTLFLIYWQRFQSLITFQWGTLRMNAWEEPRGNYYGRLALDPVTGKMQRRFPYFTTALRTFGLSFPIILVLCCVSIWGMWIYLVIEDEMRESFKKNATPESKESMSGRLWEMVLLFIPGTVYAIGVVIANKGYRLLAKWLTEWENHRTEVQFERHLVLKMVVFEVANNFSIFFYTAFVLRDMDLLRRRLLIFLTVVQVWSILEQCVVPLVLRKGQKGMSSLLDRHRHAIWPKHSSGGVLRKPRSYPGLEENDIEVMSSDDPRVEMSKVEELMYPYNHEADFDDYLNLFLQFGYIFFFSSVFPAAALFAFVCNIALLGTSLFKRREVYQRSIATRVGGIGAWYQAFEFMAVIAVITNCALIGLKLRKKFPAFTDWEWTLICFGAEHVIIAIQYFVQKVVPRIPYKVKVALAALEYHSREAFKREQARHTRRRLTKVFRPINEKLQLRNKTKEDERKSVTIKNGVQLRRRTDAAHNSKDTTKSRPSSTPGPSQANKAAPVSVLKRRN